jgi:3-phosphoshikimate 1-carboxyvinyltransferase
MQPSSELAIEPVTEPIAATVQPPGSKSLTNRALVLAALGSTGEPITLTGALRSEDTEVMVESLRRLGFAAAFADATTITVCRPAGSARIPAELAELDVANSGTSMRFLTALVSLGVGSYRLDGVPRMRQRPIADLLTALDQLGVEARSEAGTGCPPVIVRGSGDWPGQRRIAVGGAVSSQFLSALMLSAPFVSGQTWFLPDQQAVSRSYVEMTRAVLRQWGLAVTASPEEGYCIPGEQTTPCRHYAIEPDASAASYFFAAAGDHRRAGAGAGLVAAEPARRRALCRLPPTDGLHGHLACGCNHRARARAAARRGRGPQRSVGYGYDASSGRAVCRGGRPPSATSPTSATRKPTGSRRWRAN